MLAVVDRGLGFPRRPQAGTDAGPGREGISPRTSQEAQRMRKLVSKLGVPVILAVAGAATWFTLIPGRSGAG